MATAPHPLPGQTLDLPAALPLDCGKTLPGVRNPTTDAGQQGLAAYVDIDRDEAARLGITASSIDDALYNAFGQRIVSTIFTETNQYRVILEAARDDAVSLQSVVNLPLKTSSGVTTPLSSIAKVRDIIFDEGTAGDVEMYCYTREWNNDAETTLGPFVAPNPIDAHFAGRTARMKVVFQTNGQWGAPRFDIVSGGRR